LLYSTLAKWLGGVAVPAMQPQSSAEPAAAVPAGGDPAVIDLSVLAQTWGNNREKIFKYAKLFMVSLQDNMKEVEAALERGDVMALSKLGHSAKSSARTVGAHGYGDLCEALERCKSGGTLEQARAIIMQMRELLPRIEAQIRQVLA
jgi:HPt (histidine-containing phosphotransfer) domain-containing protein